MHLSEFDDAYDDKELIKGAIVSKPLSELALRVPVVVDADATIVAAVDAMNEHRTGCVLVQRDGKLVGIFTERDVLTKVIFRDGNRTWKVEQSMTPDPETLPPSATIAYALNMMSVGGYRHIPVVDRDNKPVGVVSLRDIADFVVDIFPDSVINLPPSPDKAIASTVDGG